MPDCLNDLPVTLDSLAVHVQPTTPNEGADLSNASCALNVATAGQIRITTVVSDVVVYFHSLSVSKFQDSQDISED